MRFALVLFPSCVEGGESPLPSPPSQYHVIGGWLETEINCPNFANSTRANFPQLIVEPGQQTELTQPSGSVSNY